MHLSRSSTRTTYTHEVLHICVLTDQVQCSQRCGALSSTRQQPWNLHRPVRYTLDDTHLAYVAMYTKHPSWFVREIKQKIRDGLWRSWVLKYCRLLPMSANIMWRWVEWAISEASRGKLGVENIETKREKIGAQQKLDENVTRPLFTLHAVHYSFTHKLYSNIQLWRTHANDTFLPFLTLVSFIV